MAEKVPYNPDAAKLAQTASPVHHDIHGEGIQLHPLNGPTIDIFPSGTVILSSDRFTLSATRQSVSLDFGQPGPDSPTHEVTQFPDAPPPAGPAPLLPSEATTAAHDPQNLTEPDITSLPLTAAIALIQSRGGDLSHQTPRRARGPQRRARPDSQDNTEPSGPPSYEYGTGTKVALNVLVGAEGQLITSGRKNWFFYPAVYEHREDANGQAQETEYVLWIGAALTKKLLDRPDYLKLLTPNQHLFVRAFRHEAKPEAEDPRPSLIACYVSDQQPASRPDTGTKGGKES